MLRSLKFWKGRIFYLRLRNADERFPLHYEWLRPWEVSSLNDPWSFAASDYLRLRNAGMQGPNLSGGHVPPTFGQG